MIVRFHEVSRNDVHCIVSVFSGMGDEDSTLGLSGSLVLDTKLWDDMKEHGLATSRYFGNVYFTRGDDMNERA